jgi:hypothetical protein
MSEFFAFDTKVQMQCRITISNARRRQDRGCFRIQAPPALNRRDENVPFVNNHGVIIAHRRSQFVQRLEQSIDLLNRVIVDQAQTQ